MRYKRKFKGVSRQPAGWRAKICIGNSTKTLGYFDSEVEAALVYDVAALEHFGASARLNFQHPENREKALAFVERLEAKKQSASVCEVFHKEAAQRLLR